MTFILLLGILGLVFIALCVGGIFLIDPIVAVLGIAGIYGLIRKFIIKD